MQNHPSIVLAAVGVLSIASAASATLVEAGAFNAFIFNGINYINSDFEGRVYAGGDVTFQNMGVGASLSNSNGARDDLIVGGVLQWTNGQVFGGNIRHAGAATLNSVGTPNGSAYQAPLPVYNPVPQAWFNTHSQFWAGLAANSSSVNNFGQLNLTGGDANLSIFSLTTADLGGINGLSITAAASATVLINVTGASATLQNFGFFLSGGVTDDRILFNFVDATSITISSVSVEGSIVAPLAAVNFNNGQMDGTLIASSLMGTGEFHHRPFTGDLPKVPAPGAAALAALTIAAAARRRR